MAGLCVGDTVFYEVGTEGFMVIQINFRLLIVNINKLILYSHLVYLNVYYSCALIQLHIRDYGNVRWIIGTLPYKWKTATICAWKNTALHISTRHTIVSVFNQGVLSKRGAWNVVSPEILHGGQLSKQKQMLLIRSFCVSYDRK